MTTRVLFVCSGNIDRSPTAEALLKLDNRYETKSAGILQGARVPVDGELLDWADVVFAMEELHKKVILRIMPEARDKIIVLNIPDKFPYGSPKLVRLLIRRLRSNGIKVPFAAWDVFLEHKMRQIVLEKRHNGQGKCECGARIVLAYDGERVCQNCGKVYGRSDSPKRKDRAHIPYSNWNGLQDNQEKQLETDVEKRGWA